MEYIRSLRGAGIAEAVKRADLADNMDPARVACLPEGERGIIRRYARALAALDA